MHKLILAKRKYIDKNTINIRTGTWGEESSLFISELINCILGMQKQKIGLLKL